MIKILKYKKDNTQYIHPNGLEYKNGELILPIVPYRSTFKLIYDTASSTINTNWYNSTTAGTITFDNITWTYTTSSTPFISWSATI